MECCTHKHRHTGGTRVCHYQRIWEGCRTATNSRFDQIRKKLLRIHLKVRANATAAGNGTAEDDGTIINSVGRGPQ
ncbi:MAG: hypothetical protein ABI923_08510, partial [bacterium]